MSTDLTQQVNKHAVQFWEIFISKEKQILELLFKKNKKDFDTADRITNKIMTDINWGENLRIIYGIGVRNGVELKERDDSIELIISPLLQKSKIIYLNALYNNIPSKLSTRFCVVKYKFWHPDNIEQISINFQLPNTSGSDTPEVVSVTHKNIMFHEIINQKELKLSLMIFVDDEIAKFLVEKKNIMTEKKKEREVLLPINSGIYALLDSAIGEYNMLHRIDKMEIYLKSEHTNIERKPINELKQSLNMLCDNPLSPIHKCGRCHYTSLQTKLLTCKCKKQRYCDVICQRGHWNIHKKSCLK